jgi:hypothetical protein
MNEVFPQRAVGGLAVYDCQGRLLAMSSMDYLVDRSECPLCGRRFYFNIDGVQTNGMLDQFCAGCGTLLTLLQPGDAEGMEEDQFAVDLWA